MKLKDRKKLLTIMEIQEVSRRDVAKAAGWSSHSYMNRLCNGEVDTLQPEPALRIAKFLGVAVDDLFLTKVEEKNGSLEHQNGRSVRAKASTARTGKLRAA